MCKEYINNVAMRQQDKKQSGILGTLENGQKISLKRYSTCKRKVSLNLLTFMSSQMYKTLLDTNTFLLNNKNNPSL